MLGSIFIAKFIFTRVLKNSRVVANSFMRTLDFLCQCTDLKVLHEAN